MLWKYLTAVVTAGLLFCRPAGAQTADELVSKNIKARGGMEKIKAVKSMKITAKVILQGIEAPMTIQSKRPHFLRSEFTLQGQTLVQAFDGTTAWAIMPFNGSNQPQAMSEQEAKEVKTQADLDGPLVDYKQKGHKLEFIGKEGQEGAPVYKLKLTRKDGETLTIYLDGKTFLESRQASRRKQQGEEVEIENYFSDYKPVNGLMIPHTMESKVKNQTIAQIVLTKVETDTPVDEALFKMPLKGKEK